MVKGISRQVIVVQSPDQKLFEQAIFILRDDQPPVSDEVLLKEAKRLINMPPKGKGKQMYLPGPVWACSGALLTAAVWLLSAMF